jgi:WD40 repeat protein
VVAFSADGESLLATRGSSVTSAEIWDILAGKLLRSFENVGENDWENEASINPDGQFLAVRGNFWDLVQGRRMDELDKISAAFPYPPMYSAFSGDGETIALGLAEGRVALWDMKTNRLIRNLENPERGYTGEVVSLAFSPDGMTLAVLYGFPDFVVQLWDVDGGKPLYNLHGYSFRRVVFSPDGATLLTLSTADDYTEKGGLQVWRVADGELQALIAPHGATSASISPDGSLVASGDMDGTVRLWRFSDGELLNEFPGHNGWVYGLDFSPSGELIASSATDGMIILWGMP